MSGHRIARNIAFMAVALVIAAGCVTGGEAGLLSQSESERTGWKGSQGDTPDMQMVARGRQVAQRECARCHSIDESSVSRDPSAPPFRDFVFLNDPDWVAYRLIDGIRLGHQNMPLFDFDVQSADALMAYISTLND